MSRSVPDVSAAVELAQSLHAQATELPHQQLTEKLTNARQALARFDARRAVLREAHTQAVAAVRKREATLLLEQSDLMPARDAEYCELREKVQASREELLALAPEEERLRQLVGALNRELQARESRLRQLVQQAGYDF